jgi:F0F1-type ATP synthase membrane subunit b/b'
MMVLKYESYQKTIEDQERHETDIRVLKEQYRKDMEETRQQIKDEMKKQLAELITRIKPDILKEGLQS